MFTRWEAVHPLFTIDHLGYIPQFLNEDDPRSAIEQIHQNYISGWNEFKGFEVNPETGRMKYPGDPAYTPIAKAKFHDETLYFYQHAWFTVIKADGSIHTARLD